MASSDPRKELDCCVCLNIYTDPVNLRCGHNFCRVCIDRVLDSQKGFGYYSCPQCRDKFQERPTLQRNITLRKIVDNLWSPQPNRSDNSFLCTYCIHSLEPAVKLCLMCEAFLCYGHLEVHSKSPEHVLAELMVSGERKKCSFHKELLKYYFHEDDAYICVSCSLTRVHQEHQGKKTEGEASVKKRKWIHFIQKLKSEREEIEKRVQSLQQCRRKVQEEAGAESERLSNLIRDLRRQLDNLDQTVQSEIARQEEWIVCIYNNIIQQLEIKKETLSKKIHRMEDLCQMPDPMIISQEPDTGELYDAEQRERHDKELRDGGSLDVASFSHTFHAGLSDIFKGVIGGVYIQEADEITLDIKTAQTMLHISGDHKTASRKCVAQKYKYNIKRFTCYPQVLSRQSFSSGRHYWEADVARSSSWRIGMCYPSLDRKGQLESAIGWNDKSWGLDRTGNTYTVRHRGEEIWLPEENTSSRIRVYLDYEAGQISFYDMCHPMRHLHTFTATFTEPLHAALYVWKGSVRVLRGDQRM
ncbi:tripartite motif-containing protein 75-like [Hyperolius riggenbachi]|uniref:tripartite motif-containing protein 75-like n=1 Tax=Hyperolius riggenbachi TaxID=752182 RepID=UPI0035A2DDBA